jgi:hypothetical protein
MNSEQKSSRWPKKFTKRKNERKRQESASVIFCSIQQKRRNIILQIKIYWGQNRFIQKFFKNSTITQILQSLNLTPPRQNNQLPGKNYCQFGRSTPTYRPPKFCMNYTSRQAKLRRMEPENKWISEWTSAKLSRLMNNQVAFLNASESAEYSR